MTKTAPIHLTVTSLAYQGQGIAHHQGKVFFIDDALPGDQVLVDEIEDHGGWAVVRDANRQVSSPLRQPSPCPYSDRCGGCQWLEFPYNEQLRWKASFIDDALTRVGKLSAPAPIKVEASVAQLHYRNRISLRGQITAAGRLELGYFRKNTRELVAIDRCMIAADPLNQVLSQLLTLPLPELSPQKFRLSLQVSALAENQQTAAVLVTLQAVSGVGHELAPLIDRIQALPQVWWCGTARERKEPLLIPFAGSDAQPLYTAPDQFQQVNLGQNSQLRSFVAEQIERRAPRGLVLDLFCGTGNLSLGLATEARRIIGVERNPLAITIAKYMVGRYQLPGATYLDMAADVFLSQWGAKQPAPKRGRMPRLPAHLKELAQSTTTIAAVIADPPRAGMKECIPHLLRLRPQLIIYISCDPVTMARDVGLLREHYTVAELRGYDFFPQTFHVESLAILTAFPLADAAPNAPYIAP